MNVLKAFVVASALFVLNSAAIANPAIVVDGEKLDRSSYTKGAFCSYFDCFTGHKSEICYEGSSYDICSVFQHLMNRRNPEHFWAEIDSCEAHRGRVNIEYSLFNDYGQPQISAIRQRIFRCRDGIYPSAPSHL